MTCNFTSFPTELQSYQDDERVIMNDFMQWNPVFRLKSYLSAAGTELDISISAGQFLTR